MVVKEILTQEAAITWLPWAVQYFFIVALAYGAVWIAAGEVLRRRAANPRLLKLCGVLMIATAVVAPVALLADLHQPARAWHFYAQLRPSSWMWFGAMLLPLFVLLSLTFGWLLLREEIARRGLAGDRLARLCRRIAPAGTGPSPLLRPVALAAAVSGASIALYTGMEVRVVEARALWNTPFLPLILVMTALVAVLGALLVLNLSLHTRPEEAGQRLLTQRSLLKELGWLTLASAGLIQAWVSLGGDSAAQAFHMYKLSPAWALAADWVLLTFVALGLLLLLAVKAPRAAGLLSALVALHLAWGVRWIILIEGQTLPKYGAGTYFYQIAWGPDGVLGIAGTFGLLLALLVLLSELVRREDTTAIPLTTRRYQGMGEA